jgi:hypothetical protein
MASKAHQFIADLISRKINERGFDIVSFDGVNCESIKYKLPPTISRHRPDIIGYKNGELIIGEAKTKNDISKRTIEQINDFIDLTKNKTVNCSLILGFPLSILLEINNILSDIEYNKEKVYLLEVPDSLLPNND